MFNDKINSQVIGTLSIYDKDSGTILVKKKNAIHPGNMAYVLACALSGSSTSVNQGNDSPYIDWMAFGNGGSQSGTTISYRSPNVSEIYDELAMTSSTSKLYSKTYQQKTNNTVYFPGEDMGDGEVVPNRTAKINFKVELSHDAYEDMQQLEDPSISTPETDSSTDTKSVDAFTFDEIGLIAGVTDGIGELVEDKSLMMTHVTFHPVLLSKNRTIVIDYTITIQVS